jgi:AmiR/NasT family two-component response regulator
MRAPDASQGTVLRRRDLTSTPSASTLTPMPHRPTIASAEHEPRRRWRIAIFDAPTSAPLRLTRGAIDLGVEVGVAGCLRPDILPLIRSTHCDAVLLAMDVPDPGALRMLRDVGCPMVLCSGDPSSDMVGVAQSLGAMAFLLKPVRAEQIAPTVSLAIARFRETERLQRSLAERKIIERAKGRLMLLRGATEDDAFRWLRRRAMDTRSRIADVAREVLNTRASATR